MFTSEQLAKIRAVKAVILDKMTSLREQSYIQTCDRPVMNDMFLTGGAIASLLQQEEPKDWDIYFRGSEYMTYLATHLNNHSADIADIAEAYREDYGINGKMITNKATTMKNGYSFITMQYGTPDEIKRTFDYLHTTPHYDILENKLYISPAQYDACVNKKLIVNSPTVVKSYRREKFIQRGYKEC